MVGEAPYPDRLVLRQVRSLDPGLRSLPPAVRALPVPRDILMRASLVENVRCTSAATSVDHTEVLTDPLAGPDMGHSQTPFVIGSQATQGATCTRVALFASPGQMLIGLIANGDAFVIVG